MSQDIEKLKEKILSLISQNSSVYRMLQNRDSNYLKSIRINEEEKLLFLEYKVYYLLEFLKDYLNKHIYQADRKKADTKLYYLQQEIYSISQNNYDFKSKEYNTFKFVCLNLDLYLSPKENDIENLIKSVDKNNLDNDKLRISSDITKFLLLKKNIKEMKSNQFDDMIDITVSDQKEIMNLTFVKLLSSSQELFTLASLLKENRKNDTKVTKNIEEVNIELKKFYNLKNDVEYNSELNKEVKYSYLKSSKTNITSKESLFYIIENMDISNVDEDNYLDFINICLGSKLKTGLVESVRKRRKKKQIKQETKKEQENSFDELYKEVIGIIIQINKINQEKQEELVASFESLKRCLIGDINYKFTILNKRKKQLEYINIIKTELKNLEVVNLDTLENIEKFTESFNQKSQNFKLIFPNVIKILEYSKYKFQIKYYKNEIDTIKHFLSKKVVDIISKIDYDKSSISQEYHSVRSLYYTYKIFIDKFDESYENVSESILKEIVLEVFKGIRVSIFDIDKEFTNSSESEILQDIFDQQISLLKEIQTVDIDNKTELKKESKTNIPNIETSSDTSIVFNSDFDKAVKEAFEKIDEEPDLKKRIRAVEKIKQRLAQQNIPPTSSLNKILKINTTNQAEFEKGITEVKNELEQNNQDATNNFIIQVNSLIDKINQEDNPLPLFKQLKELVNKSPKIKWYDPTLFRINLIKTNLNKLNLNTKQSLYDSYQKTDKKFQGLFPKISIIANFDSLDNDFLDNFAKATKELSISKEQEEIIIQNVENLIKNKEDQITYMKTIQNTLATIQIPQTNVLSKLQDIKTDTTQNFTKGIIKFKDLLKASNDKREFQNQVNNLVIRANKDNSPIPLFKELKELFEHTPKLNSTLMLIKNNLNLLNLTNEITFNQSFRTTDKNFQALFPTIEENKLNIKDIIPNPEPYQNIDNFLIKLIESNLGNSLDKEYQKLEINLDLTHLDTYYKEFTENKIREYLTQEEYIKAYQNLKEIDQTGLDFIILAINYLTPKYYQNKYNLYKNKKLIKLTNKLKEYTPSIEITFNKRDDNKPEQIFLHYLIINTFEKGMFYQIIEDIHINNHILLNIYHQLNKELLKFNQIIDLEQWENKVKLLLIEEYTNILEKEEEQSQKEFLKKSKQEDREKIIKDLIESKNKLIEVIQKQPEILKKYIENNMPELNIRIINLSKIEERFQNFYEANANNINQRINQTELDKKSSKDTKTDDILNLNLKVENVLKQNNPIKQIYQLKELLKEDLPKTNIWTPGRDAYNKLKIIKSNIEKLETQNLIKLKQSYDKTDDKFKKIFQLKEFTPQDLFPQNYEVIIKVNQLIDYLLNPNFDLNLNYHIETIQSQVKDQTLSENLGDYYDEYIHLNELSKDSYERLFELKKEYISRFNPEEQKIILIKDFFTKSIYDKKYQQYINFKINQININKELNINYTKNSIEEIIYKLIVKVYYEKDFNLINNSSITINVFEKLIQKPETLIILNRLEQRVEKELIEAYEKYIDKLDKKELLNKLKDSTKAPIVKLVNYIKDPIAQIKQDIFYKIQSRKDLNQKQKEQLAKEEFDYVEKISQADNLYQELLVSKKDFITIQPILLKLKYILISIPDERNWYTFDNINGNLMKQLKKDILRLSLNDEESYYTQLDNINSKLKKVLKNDKPAEIIEEKKEDTPEQEKLSFEKYYDSIMNNIETINQKELNNDILQDFQELQIQISKDYSSPKAYQFQKKNQEKEINIIKENIEKLNLTNLEKFMQTFLESEDKFRGYFKDLNSEIESKQLIIKDINNYRDELKVNIDSLKRNIDSLNKEVKNKKKVKILKMIKTLISYIKDNYNHLKQKYEDLDLYKPNELFQEQQNQFMQDLNIRGISKQEDLMPILFKMSELFPSFDLGLNIKNTEEESEKKSDLKENKEDLKQIEEEVFLELQNTEFKELKNINNELKGKDMLEYLTLIYAELKEGSSETYKNTFKPYLNALEENSKKIENGEGSISRILEEQDYLILTYKILKLLKNLTDEKIKLFNKQNKVLEFIMNVKSRLNNVSKKGTIKIEAPEIKGINLEEEINKI